MVRGIDRFKDYFKDHTDKYVMIGGTACDIAMIQMGLDFRATRDLDIVLVVEAVDAEFGSLFWEFVKEGQYQNKQKSTGKSLFYRFDTPKDDTYPYMLELFYTMQEARRIIEQWIMEYNKEPPHGFLEGKTPAMFMEECEEKVKKMFGSGVRLFVIVHLFTTFARKGTGLHTSYLYPAR
jgi:transposase InsO family protein